MMETECRHFTGYKPCGKNQLCDSSCPSRDIPRTRILVVHLEALGAVLRATSLLPAIHRRFVGAHITWVTQAPAHELLINNPFIDRILTTGPEGLLALSALEFDVAICLDKSLKASGVLNQTRADVHFGFRADPRTGAIVPCDDSARELWEIGLDDHRKFQINRKSEARLLTEAAGLAYRRDGYVYRMTQSEEAEIEKRRKKWGTKKSLVIGINTGASGVVPYKKLTVDGNRQMIAALKRAFWDAEFVLLGGGPQDEERNRKIGEGLGVIQSAANLGLRDGMISVAACDIVVSGDSLGMHMGIALEKWVVAWFGPTCAHEIEFFDRGRAVLSRATCGPCWKRSCQKETMCYDLVSFEEIVNAVREGVRWLQAKKTSEKTSSSKPPSSGTFSSPSL